MSGKGKPTKGKAEESLYLKKCPLCGHSALEHKHGASGRSGDKRFCFHPIPAGAKGTFKLCLCEISDRDYVRTGNFALIRADARRWTEPEPIRYKLSDEARRLVRET